MGPTCTGEWRERHLPGDGHHDVALFKCSGCGEWSVIIASRMYGDYPADWTAEEALRAAFKDRTFGTMAVGWE